MLLRMWQIFHILCIVWTNAEIVFLEAYSSKTNTPLKTRRFYANTVLGESCHSDVC